MEPKGPLFTEVFHAFSCHPTSTNPISSDVFPPTPMKAATVAPLGRGCLCRSTCSPVLPFQGCTEQLRVPGRGRSWAEGVGNAEGENEGSNLTALECRGTITEHLSSPSVRTITTEQPQRRGPTKTNDTFIPTLQPPHMHERTILRKLGKIFTGVI